MKPTTKTDKPMLMSSTTDETNTLLGHIHNAIQRIGQMLPRQDIEIAILLRPGANYRCAIRLGESHWLKDMPLAVILEQLRLTDQERAEKAASAQRLADDFKAQVEFYDYLNQWKDSEPIKPPF
jgi:hypothetical protein